MAASSKQPINRATNLLPRTAHSAIIWKKQSLWGGGGGGGIQVHHHPCPNIRHDKTYHGRPWIWANPEIFTLDPGERLYDYLRAFYQVFQGEPILYIIDDCSATKALTRTRDMLSELAFSGRHADQNVWVLTQKYKSVLKDCASRRAG